MYDIKIRFNYDILEPVLVLSMSEIVRDKCLTPIKTFDVFQHTPMH